MFQKYKEQSENNELSIDRFTVQKVHRFQKNYRVRGFPHYVYSNNFD